MDDLLLNMSFLLSRWLHIVCTTVLVGGTLFYEMVVPIAIDDLKQQHQLSVFARARWVFRSLVWISAALLVLTGVASTYVHWGAYTTPESAQLTSPTGTSEALPAGQRPGWWWAAHASAGGITILIALFLTTGGRPPERPVQWMRFNLVLLLIVIFLASATRQVRMAQDERAGGPGASPAQGPRDGR